MIGAQSPSRPKAFSKYIKSPSILTPPHSGVSSNSWFAKHFARFSEIGQSWLTNREPAYCKIIFNIQVEQNKRKRCYIIAYIYYCEAVICTISNGRINCFCVETVLRFVGERSANIFPAVMLKAKFIVLCVSNSRAKTWCELKVMFEWIAPRSVNG